MARRRDFRTNFDFGELSEDYLRRADTETLRRACRRFRNAFLISAGGFIRRPGTQELAVIDPGTPRIYPYKGRDGLEIFVLTPERLDVYDPDGTKTRTFTTGIPWTADHLDSLVIEADADKVYVYHQAFQTRVFTKHPDALWARSSFTFLSGAGSEILQPYYRFGDKSVTMDVAAYTGTGVDVAFSDDVLTADHVGARFRYMLSNEIEITAVTDGQNGECTIHSRLYPTVNITVSSSTGFKVGHAVQTELDELSGVVAAISGSTVTVVMDDGYDIPEIPSSGDPNALIGPETKQDISAASSAGTPAAVSIWDEQMISAARGYPGTGAIHRGRHFLAGFPEAPDAIAASAIGSPNEFFTGGGTLTDADGFIETLGNEPNSEIRHFMSAEQLIVFTDRGVYYVPESGDNPITPASITFLRIGPEGASVVQPALASEGILFIDENANRLLAVVPTGNVRQSWAVVELSELSYELIGEAKRLTIANGLDGRSERVVFILNADGTITTVMYRRGSEVTGWGIWSRGRGDWKDIVSDEDDVFITANVDGEDRLCKFSFAAVADDETSYESAIARRSESQSVVIENRSAIGFGFLDETGALPGVATDEGKTAGIDFALEVEPAPPINENIGWQRQRIVSGRVDVLDTGAFRVNDQLFWPYQGGDDLSEVGKVRSRTERVFALGWSDGPGLKVQQSVGEAALLEVRAITMEVAY